MDFYLASFVIEYRIPLANKLIAKKLWIKKFQWWQFKPVKPLDKVALASLHFPLNSVKKLKVRLNFIDRTYIAFKTFK